MKHKVLNNVGIIVRHERQSMYLQINFYIDVQWIIITALSDTCTHAHTHKAIIIERQLEEILIIYSAIKISFFILNKHLHTHSLMHCFIALPSKFISFSFFMIEQICSIKKSEAFELALRIFISQLDEYIIMLSMPSFLPHKSESSLPLLIL